MLRIRLVAAAILAAALPAAALGTTSATAAPSPRQPYLVTLAPGASVSDFAAAMGRQGARVTKTYGKVLRGAAVMMTPAQAAALASNPSVAAVETDGIATVAGTQVSAPWGLDRSDARSGRDGSYTYPTDAAGVRIFIVDTGVRADHADFGGRVTTGWTGIADGNGTSDCHGHGTHVAGTAAGATYGLAKSATIVPVRVLDCTGSGAYSTIISSLDWIAAQHTATSRDVVSMSLGGGANSTLDTAVANLVAAGVPVVVAAGNSNVDACTSSPARAGAAITVGAVDSADLRASFSNFGTCLDLFAPGVSITSDSPASATATATMSGTSMATPHVSGALAVALAMNPTLTPIQAADALVRNATANVVGSAGTGSPNRMLYVSQSAYSSATAPTAPAGVTAVAGKGAATVSWTLGADGGSPLTSQTVVTYTSTGVKVSSTVVSATAKSVSIKLARGSYYFKVFATNAVGSSPESAASKTVRI